MKKRIVALLLGLALLIGCLSACAENTPDTDIGAQTTTAPVIVDEVSLEPYRIIYSLDANYKIRQEINQLTETVLETGGIDLDPSVENLVPKEASAYEILVGETKRDESVNAAAELRENDYLIRYDHESKRFLVQGGNAESTLLALQHFISDFIDPEEKSLSIPENNTFFFLADYTLRSLEVDGVSIRDYTVVYPKKADLLTYSAALNIVDFFQANMGISLPLVTDQKEETEYEILVGNTNRAQSSRDCSFGEGQYLMMKDGGKIIFQGHSYMIGGAFGAFLSHIDLTGVNTTASVTGLPTEATAKTYTYGETCTNVILMIGDGMGYNQVELAKGNGLGTFYAELLPSIGSAITRSQSVLDGSAAYTDSAAAATALATGYKTTNGRVGQNASGIDVMNIRELAFVKGAQTAVISTDDIAGATPASFLAHVSNRNNTTPIYTQIDQLTKGGRVDYCKGSIEDLVLQTRNALMEISDANTPFFAMIEEGYIDKKCHSADMDGCYDMVERFNASIAYVIEFVLCHPGTALIITADHETGGIIQTDSKEAALAQIKDSRETEKVIKAVERNINKYGYSFTAYTGDSSCEHTNANVPVYAMGPGTEIFHDTATENIDIARFMAKAFGMETFGQSNPIPPVS